MIKGNTYRYNNFDVMLLSVFNIDMTLRRQKCKSSVLKSKFEIDWLSEIKIMINQCQIIF